MCISCSCQHSRSLARLNSSGPRRRISNIVSTWHHPLQPTKPVLPATAHDSHLLTSPLHLPIVHPRNPASVQFRARGLRTRPRNPTAASRFSGATTPFPSIWPPAHPNHEPPQAKDEPLVIASNDSVHDRIHSFTTNEVIPWPSARAVGAPS